MTAIFRKIAELIESISLWTIFAALFVWMVILLSAALIVDVISDELDRWYRNRR